MLGACLLPTGVGLSGGDLPEQVRPGDPFPRAGVFVTALGRRTSRGRSSSTRPPTGQKGHGQRPPIVVAPTWPFFARAATIVDEAWHELDRMAGAKCGLVERGQLVDRAA